MRRLLTLSLTTAVLFCASGAMAQITIPTNGFNPPLGTVLNYRSDASAATATFYNTVAAGTGGTMTWDFTGHTLATSFQSTIVSAATAPDIASFPGANFVFRTPVGFDTSWAIDVRGNTTFKQLGYVSNGTTGHFVTAYTSSSTEDWQFPIANGNQWTSWKRRSNGTAPNYTDIWDSIFYSVDAWGNAKYGANLIPCLRVKAREVFTFNTYVNNILIGSNKTTINKIILVGAGFTTLAQLDKVEGVTPTYSSFIWSDLYNTTTDVIEDPSLLPTGFTIDQNYPNPFNPRTEIRFSIPTRSDVKLVVYNSLGQQVKVLVDATMGAGSYIADWDGNNEHGQPVATGIYLYRISAGDLATTKKMILLK